MRANTLQAKRSELATDLINPDQQRAQALSGYASYQRTLLSINTD